MKAAFNLLLRLAVLVQVGLADGEVMASPPSDGQLQAYASARCWRGSATFKAEYTRTCTDTWWSGQGCTETKKYRMVCSR